MAFIFLILWEISQLSYTAGSSYFFFIGDYKTRDEAQFCCNRYGMTLPRVTDVNENEYLYNSLKNFKFDKLWIGVFPVRDKDLRLMWDDTLELNFTNWDTESGKLVTDFLNDTSQNSSLCVYGDVMNNFKWKVVPCTEKTQFGCQVASETGSPLTTNLTDVDCPDLLKMTAENVQRDSVKHHGGFGTAGTHALFRKQKIITKMGRTLSQKNKIRSSAECVLHCLSTPGCNDVIIMNHSFCIMYET